MKGKWHGAPYHDYTTKKWLITFEVDRVPRIYDKTKDKPILLDVEQYFPKRSNNANRYFYSLVNDIAEALNIPDVDVHDRLLAENIAYVVNDGVRGYLISDEKANKYRLLRKGEDYYLDSLQRVRLSTEDGEPLYDRDGNPKTSIIYWHIKGSHQMTTKEFGRLLESTIDEAKQLGIEVEDAEEIERLVKMWEA
jgi:hypothetical protein